jgi:CheY-like chemotaxis protein
MAKTCLIAEHDPWEIQVLRLYAERLGYQTVQVYETQSVLPLAEQAKPEIIVLEAELPGTMDSLEVVRALKTHSKTCSVAILFLTTLDRRAVEEAGIEVESCLQKPATYRAFRKALVELASRR